MGASSSIQEKVLQAVFDGDILKLKVGARDKRSSTFAITSRDVASDSDIFMQKYAPDDEAGRTIINLARDKA